jgi:hypothetical protein
VKETKMAEKKWNKKTDNWEIDGVPVTYRVKWKNIDDGEYYSKEFDDVDNGYDYYQRKLKNPHCIDVTWEHIPW